MNQLLAVALGVAALGLSAPAAAQPDRPRPQRYTTFFYTAAEAVVHGYHANTDVRIVSMQTGEPVWTGRVGAGETRLVPTGAGVFSFIADQKATILVGTPSACTMVGYWARDEEGSFRSDHFFVQLPLSTNTDEDQVVVWAWEPTRVTVTDRTTGRRVWAGDLPAYGRHVLPRAEVQGLGAHVLDVRAETAAVSVQVYYDQGFAVPSSDGRAAGRDFVTVIGNTNAGANDLVLASYHANARVSVRNIDTEQVVWRGVVPRGGVHTLTLHTSYLRIESDVDIQAMVAPYQHHTGGYAEHHYGGGAEGTGIENDFILPTPGQLWIFSYFANNGITVEDMESGRTVWSGTLGAGNAQPIQTGHGLFRVRGTTGTSVMGGQHACGAEFSPAGRMFEVDEALLRAVVEIRQERQAQARARGETLTPAAAAAPLSADELEDAARRVNRATRSQTYDAPAMRQRLEAMEAN